MSGKAVGYAFDIQGLTPTEKLVLVAYADHADHNGENIFPAVDTIEKKTGLSRRSVQRATKSLSDQEILISCGDGPRGTNKWKLDLGGVSVTPPKLERGDSVSNGGVSVSHGGDSVSKSLGDTVTPDPLTVINLHINALADYFSEITALKISRDGQGKPSFYWREPLDDLYQLNDEDLDATRNMIKRAVKQMDDDGLTISSPKSILKIAKAMHAKRQRTRAGAPSGLWG